MTEAEARREIVAYCRALWDRHLVTGTSGNVSVKLDDGDLLATPQGVSLRALRETELVRTDRTGNPRESGQRPTSELPLHLAAYRVRPEVVCVVHTHPTFCVVWSKLGHVFPRDTVGARETLGPCAWTPYRPPGTLELAEVAATAFAQPVDTVLMERHGLSCVGATLEDAFVRTDLAEEAARIAYFSRLAEIPASAE